MGIIWLIVSFLIIVLMINAPGYGKIVNRLKSDALTVFCNLPGIESVHPLTEEGEFPWPLLVQRILMLGIPRK
jgi:hypothetical protein